MLNKDASIASRHILAVVTVGRGTHAAPILEICRILHSRGHIIHLACIDGFQDLDPQYSFISKVHIIASKIKPEDDEKLHSILDESDIRDWESRKGLAKVLQFMERSWIETHKNLRALISKERPDFIFGDLLDQQACVDMRNEFNIPMAIHFGQMPFHLAPAKYIPGLPGFQQRYLTSEHASIWGRISEDFFALGLVFSLRHHFRWRKQMRDQAGAAPLAFSRKPDSLILVNTFFGFEPPKELPPLLVPVGPILSDNYSPSTPELESFLSTHKNVLYIAFGSHINLTGGSRFTKLFDGINSAIQSGFIDGVVWTLKPPKTSSSSSNPLPNFDPKFYHITPFAPQRAILAHPSTTLFLSHCGASSINEALFHGVPILGLPIYNDQFKYALCIENVGVGLKMDKTDFEAKEVHQKIGRMTTEPSFQQDSKRMMGIARIAARRKHLAADLIEEELLDHEGRFSLSSKSDVRHRRPPHLQTASARMSWFRAGNYDIYLVYALVLGSAWWIGKTILGTGIKLAMGKWLR